MTNTMISSISKTYAKSLLAAAEESSAVKLFKSQMDEISEVLESSDDLKIVMANSCISYSKKNDILESVFGGKIDVKLLNFLKILVEKGRFGEFDSIKAAYNNMLEELSNVKTVEITSPIELNFENKSNVLFKLEHKLNCEINPVWLVDKSLIAGLTFKFDDCVIDASVRSKLENLSKNITR